MEADIETLAIERLKTRPDFLRVAQAFACARGAALVQARPRGDQKSFLRVGFTATRKIGGAVDRNRAKRRLRAAAMALLPLEGRRGCDYVFIARQGTVKRPWPRLLDDVKTALVSLARDLDAPPSPAPVASAAGLP